MKPSSDVTGMYRSFPSYLWVEDEETRTYLEEIWRGESRIKIYVASGHSNVLAAVRAAHNDWNTHVFGFRDRDFGVSNRPRWRDAEVTVLAGDALELENLLLDADAIAASAVNTSGLDAAAIEQRFLGLATPLTWWMSCRRTITELHNAVLSDFVTHPTWAGVVSQQDAEDAIVTSSWWINVLPALQPAWGSRAGISAKIVQHEGNYRAMLATGAWRQEFSGKEILQGLVTRVWTRKRPENPAARLEFVRAIAEAQRKLNRVPAEMAELRTAILYRVGL